MSRPLFPAMSSPIIFIASSFSSPLCRSLSVVSVGSSSCSGMPHFDLKLPGCPAYSVSPKSREVLPLGPIPYPITVGTKQVWEECFKHLYNGIYGGYKLMDKVFAEQTVQSCTLKPMLPIGKWSLGLYFVVYPDVAVSDSAPRSRR